MQDTKTDQRTSCSIEINCKLDDRLALKTSQKGSFKIGRLQLQLVLCGRRSQTMQAPGHQAYSTDKWCFKNWPVIDLQRRDTTVTRKHCFTKKYHSFGSLTKKSSRLFEKGTKQSAI